MSLSCSRVSEDFEFVVPDLDILGSSILQQNYLGYFAALFLSPIPSLAPSSFFLLSKQTVQGEQGDFLDRAKWPPAGPWESSSFPSPIPLFQCPILSESRTLTLQAEGEGACFTSPMWPFLLIFVVVGCLGFLFAFLVWGLFRGFICVFILQCCAFYSGPCTYQASTRPLSYSPSPLKNKSYKRLEWGLESWLSG